MPWTPDSLPDLTGRVAVVTGGNGGIGLEIVRVLAGAGARVVMAARTADSAEAARDDVIATHPGSSVEIVPLDLASLDSIRSAAGVIGGRHAAIDLLVDNAGIMAVPRGETTDGFEQHFGVNHLGHFALTALLWPRLTQAGSARVVVVTSWARLWRGRFDPADPPLAGGYDPWKAYGQSKMANLRFALELDRRARAAGVRVAGLAAHPGYARTELQTRSVRASGGGWSQRFFAWGVRRVGMTPERGALSPLRAATDPQAVGGELYAPRFVTGGPPVRKPLAPWTRRSRQNRVLWEVSERLTGIEFAI